MSNQTDRTNNDLGPEGSEHLAPVNFGQSNQQLQHIVQALNSMQGDQLNRQYLQQHHHQNLPPDQNAKYSNSNLDESNPSLVYDRTNKVAKANYADHGTHGVTGVPYPGSQAPLSSVHMQMQMQQIMQQQQQQQQPQQYDTLNTMMPPPNAPLPQQPQYQSAVYPSLVPGTLGSQQFFQPLTNDTFAGNTTATTSTNLLQALNAELVSRGVQPSAPMATSAGLGYNGTGNQKGGLHLVENMVATAAQGIPQNLDTVTNLSSLPNIRKDFNNNQNNSEAPGDIRYGKKRVSPSQPFHPRQLQPHHGGRLLADSVGEYASPNSSLCMKTVAKEDGIISNISDHTNVLYNTTLNALSNYVEQLGGVATATTQVGQMPPQSQLPPVQHIEGLPFSDQQLMGGIPGYDLLAAAQVAQDTRNSQAIERFGEPLTNPAEPTTNSGLDNSEGNLIVRRGDIFKIPKSNMHYHPPLAKSKNDASSSNDENSDEVLELTALSLLGQGTFAQVFHCIEKNTGKSVAVKIVKNKPAYTRQAVVEIDVFRKLHTEDTDVGDNESSINDDERNSSSTTKKSSVTKSKEELKKESPSETKPRNSIIRLSYYFMYCSHLCLVFEMLGPNLYELLKKRQFRGLPIGAVKTLVHQAIEGIKLLGRKKVVHCDLKPENILMVRADAVDDIIAEHTRNVDDTLEAKETQTDDSEQWIKLIDFGSACFEGQTAHTYIQSRFYRSPEVLIGLPYDSAIDMWSLGCVAAELFLGLPILPGVHEHDQLGRILEMIGDLPEWMLERGTKCSKFFNVVSKRRGTKANIIGSSGKYDGSLSRTTWEFKTRQEYINMLSEDEKQSKGGMAKLEQQPTNRYFKKKRLEEIVMHHGVCYTKKEKEQLGLFVHFLKGVLDPDPWKRWTAKQASMHPFLSGSNLYRNKLGEVGPDGTRLGTKPYDIHWVPPWDASICRRKLLVVQKTKDKSRRSSIQGRVQLQQPVPEGATAQNQNLPAQSIGVYGSPMRTVIMNQQSPATITSAQVTAMTDTFSLNRLSNNGQSSSPPQNLEALLNAQLSNAYPHSSNLSASLGANIGTGLPVSYQPLIDANFANSSFSENIYPGQLAPQQSLQAIAGPSDLLFVPQHSQQHIFMGAQSFSGVYYNGMPSHYPHVEGDLGYALQRPGVFPICGNDAVSMLQRQASGQSLAYLAQPMLSSSLSNITSTPQSVQSTSSMSFQTPGDLLQQLGLQDQGSFDNNFSQMNAGNTTTSLLAQQLADYSGPDYQQQHVNAQMMINLPTGTQMAESYHGMSGPMSSSSLPQFQSSSLGNYLGTVQDQQQHLYLSQINTGLMNVQNQAHSKMNAPNENGETANPDYDVNNRTMG